MGLVTEEQATVYRSLNGRRYFTKKGAARASVWQKLKDKYECDCENDYEPDTGWICWFHTHEEDHWRRFVDRYYKIFRKYL